MKMFGEKKTVLSNIFVRMIAVMIALIAAQMVLAPFVVFMNSSSAEILSRTVKAIIAITAICLSLSLGILVYRSMHRYLARVMPGP